MRTITALLVVLLASSLEADKNKPSCKSFKCGKLEKCVIQIENDVRAYPVCINKQPIGPNCGASIYCPQGCQCTKEYDQYTHCVKRVSVSTTQKPTKKTTTQKSTTKTTTRKSTSKTTTPKSILKTTPRLILNTTPFSMINYLKTKTPKPTKRSITIDESKNKEHLFSIKK